MPVRQVAVLVGDTVGYSRLIEADTFGTVTHLMALRAGLVIPAAEYFRASFIKCTGDAFLLAFEDPADALECAIVIQSVLLWLGLDSLSQPCLSFRMGISAGDAVFVDNDIHGVCANVAARLEALAGPGEIWLCDNARRRVNEATPMQFESLGERHLHNVSTPVGVCRVPLSIIPKFAIMHFASTRSNADSDQMDAWSTWGGCLRHVPSTREAAPTARTG